jgi:hypothetical protein
MAWKNGKYVSGGGGSRHSRGSGDLSVGRRVVRSLFGIDPRESGNSFGTALLNTAYLNPQERYNGSYARSFNNEASRQGRHAGRNEGYSAYNGPQNDFNRGVRQGTRTAAYRAGRDSVRYGNAAGAQAGNGYAADGQDQNSNIIPISNKYAIDNQGVPFNNSREFAKDFRNIANGEIFGKRGLTGGRDSSSEADAFARILADGLHPDAQIYVKGQNAPISLDAFIQKEMRGKNEDQALALLAEYRQAYVSPVGNGAAQQPGLERYTNAPELQTSFNPGVATILAGATVNDSSAISFQLDMLANTQNVKIGDNGQMLNAADRITRIGEIMAQIDTKQEAEKLHTMLESNPNFSANLAALQAQALQEGMGANKQLETVNAVFAGLKKAEELDPDGNARAAAAVIQATAAQNQSHAGGASQQSTSGLSTAELAQIQIVGDDALNAKLQNAVATQGKWDTMAQDNPLAGMFMMLLRPLINMLQPDSDPNVILAQAAAKDGVSIETSSQDIANKLANQFPKADVNLNVASTDEKQQVTTETDEKQQTTTEQKQPPAEEISNFIRRPVNSVPRLLLPNAEFAALEEKMGGFGLPKNNFAVQAMDAVAAANSDKAASTSNAKQPDDSNLGQGA